MDIRRSALAIFVLAVALRGGMAGQTPPKLVVRKIAEGPITPDFLSLTLQSADSCDESGGVIPDGSSIVSQNLNFSTDERGVGSFSGFVRIVAPSGAVLTAGRLHGTIGIAAGAADAKDCLAPGHLEGTLDSRWLLPIRAGDVDSTIGGRGAGSGTPIGPRPPTFPLWELRLSADLTPQATSPVPLYSGTLAGLAAAAQPPPPDSGDVTIGADRDSYSTQDTIVATLDNETARTIAVTDHRSFCTVVELQMETGEGWQAVARCQLLSPTGWTFIGAQSQIIVKLPLMPGPMGPAPGIYRLETDYVAVDSLGQPSGTPFSIESAPFSVGL